jgi:hypothetical protein
MSKQCCKINNKEYLFDEETGFDIVIDNKRIKHPDSIFKYCSLSEKNVNALINQYLFASHPKDFNDPFDCFDRLIIPPKSPKDSCLYNEISKEIRLNDNHDLLSIFYNLLFYHSGIVSMTTNDSNMYMWTHYTFNHSGFLLKFKTDRLLKNFEGIYKVGYEESLSSVEFDEKNLAAQTLMMLCTKSDKWIAEEEWRLVAYGNKMFVPGVHDSKMHKNLIENRKIGYDFDSLEEVILGHYFFTRKNIIRIEGRKYFIHVDKKSDNSKVDFLNFIVKNSIQVKWIFLKQNDFEIEPMEIKIIKNKKMFIVEITDERF